jgi:hypothetical protein
MVLAYGRHHLPCAGLRLCSVRGAFAAAAADSPRSSSSVHREYCSAQPGQPTLAVCGDNITCVAAPPAVQWATGGGAASSTQRGLTRRPQRRTPRHISVQQQHHAQQQMPS